MSKIRDTQAQLRDIVKRYNNLKEDYKDIFAKQICDKNNLKLIQRIYWEHPESRDSYMQELHVRLEAEYELSKIKSRQTELNLKELKNLMIEFQKAISTMKCSFIYTVEINGKKHQFKNVPSLAEFLGYSKQWIWRLSARNKKFFIVKFESGDEIIVNKEIR